ncbi:hypothetical protein PMAYCL1PPCAC_24939, partial [Pristionchus mayeri]
DHNCEGWGDDLISWEDLFKVEKGFIENAKASYKIIIEARFFLANAVGIRTNPSVDFTGLNDLRHDVALVIEGEKIYASKQYLALHSTLFNAMFYGNFAER